MFSLEFKTRARDGVLFFATAETDFVALYLQNGDLVYKFNVGGGVAELRYEATALIDDMWHEVRSIRRKI